MLYAIIQTGGKQYRVQEGDEFKVEKLDAKVGDKVVFDEVIAVGGDKLIVGTPLVKDYEVTAEVLEQGKNDKVIIYKYKAKKDERTKNGHRQPYTMVRITTIGAGARKTSVKNMEAPKAEATPGKKVAAPKKEAEPSKTSGVTEKGAVKANASMKKDELLAIAKDMGIEVAAKATKADILAAIEAK